MRTALTICITLMLSAAGFGFQQYTQNISLQMDVRLLKTQTRVDKIVIRNLQTNCKIK